MKWHSFGRIVFVLVLAVLFVLVFALPALAAPAEQTPAPSDPSAILLMTVGQLIQWILASGIALFVGWTLGFFPNIPAGLKVIGGGALMAMLSAGVTYLAGQLTPPQLNMTLLQVIVFVGTALLTLVSQIVGHIKGQMHYVESLEVRGRIQQLRAGN